MKKMILLLISVFTTLMALEFTMTESGLTVKEETQPPVVETTQPPATTTTTDYSGTLGQKIFQVAFSSHPVGAYTVAMQDADFQTYNGEDLHYNNHDGSSMMGDSHTQASATIVSDNGENVLDILYTDGEFGLKANSGILLVNALPKNGRPAEDVNNPTEITLIYYIKFVGNFDWGYGGKLPGLAGGLIPSGGVTEGHYNLLNGFSARMMWEDLWGVSGKPSGMKPYIYNIQLTGGGTLYGKGPFYNSVTVPTSQFYSADNDSDSFQPSTDTWYKITQTIKANTPGNSDGIMKIWVDDVLMTDLVGLKYVADGYDGDYTVDRLCFSTFYGGGSSSWAPTRDTHIRFKDFSVYEK